MRRPPSFTSHSNDTLIIIDDFQQERENKKNQKSLKTKEKQIKKKERGQKRKKKILKTHDNEQSKRQKTKPKRGERKK